MQLKTHALYLFADNCPIVNIDYLGQYTCQHSKESYACSPCNNGQRYGIRQKDQKETNGCSSGPIGDAPAGKECSFLSACDKHDCCYGTCKSSQSECDNAFLDDMQDICLSCSRTFGQYVFCNIAASAFYSAVYAAGNIAHAENQSDHCEECCCTNNYNPWSPYHGGTQNTPPHAVSY